MPRWMIPAAVAARARFSQHYAPAWWPSTALSRRGGGLQALAALGACRWPA